MGSRHANKLRGHVEAMALSVLEKGDAHGLDIVRTLEEQGKGVLRMKEGTLYPALYRLEQKGCIRGRWETGEIRHQGARRRIYRLTKKGKRELAERREEWVEFASVMEAIVGAT